jgi:hypothetical protein
MAGLDAEQETMTRHDRRGANRRVLGLLLIGVGTVWFLEVAGLLSVSAETLLAGLLTLLGVGLIFTARRGRGWWPIALGALLTVVLVLNSNALALPTLPGFGDQTIHVHSGDTRLSFHRAIGDLTLIVDRPQGDSASPMKVNLGLGDVKVLLPTDSKVHVVSHIGVGQLTVCGNKIDDGIGINPTYDTPQTGGPHFDLTVSDGIGDVTVVCGP